MRRQLGHIVIQLTVESSVCVLSVGVVAIFIQVHSFVFGLITQFCQSEQSFDVEHVVDDHAAFIVLEVQSSSISEEGLGFAQAVVSSGSLAFWVLFTTINTQSQRVWSNEYQSVHCWGIQGNAYELEKTLPKSENQNKANKTRLNIFFIVIMIN